MSIYDAMRECARKGHRWVTVGISATTRYQECSRCGQPRTNEVPSPKWKDDHVSG